MGKLMGWSTKNFKKKEKNNYNLWIYDGSLNDAIKKCAIM